MTTARANAAPMLATNSRPLVAAIAMTFWLNLQAAYDLRAAAREAAGRIEREVSPRERRNI